MRVYRVTETYTTTRVLRVMAPDAEAAKAWDVHPKSLVLDYGDYEQGNFEFTAQEENDDSQTA